MTDLDADRGTLALHEGDQRLEAFGLRIVPDAEVILLDQSDLLDRCHLDKDEAKTAQRVAAQMDDVKCAAGVPGVAAIVHHRWHDEAIFERETSKRQRPKKLWRCRFTVARSSVSHWNIPYLSLIHI